MHFTETNAVSTRFLNYAASSRSTERSRWCWLTFTRVSMEDPEPKQPNQMVRVKLYKAFEHALKRTQGQLHSKLLIAMLICTCHSSAICQSPVFLRTNDPIIHNLSVKSDHYIFKISLLDSTDTIIYQFINDVVIDVDSSAMTFSVSRSAPYKGAIYQSRSTCNLHSFVPIRFVEYNTPLDKKVEAEFDSSSVHVNFLEMGKSGARAFGMPKGYFDDNIVELLIGYFKLTKGTTYGLNAFRYESDGNIPYEFEYLFDDFISTGSNSMVKCKVVRFQNGYLKGFIWFDPISGACIKEIGSSDKGGFILEKL